MNTKKIFLAITLFCLLLIIFVPVFASADGLVKCGNGSPIKLDAKGNPILDANKNPIKEDPAKFHACTLCDFFQMFIDIYKFIITVIAAPLATLAVIIGAICILISGGSPSLSGLGKKIIWAGAIGIVLVFLSWVIIDFVIVAITPEKSPLRNWSELKLNCK